MDFMKNFRQILQEQYESLENQEADRTGQEIEMPSNDIYDDAKWHYKLGLLKKISKELGATHIGFFLRWCEENELLSDALLKKLEENRALFAEEPEKWSFRMFVIQKMDGLFQRSDLNAEGQAFAGAYYTGKKTPFSEEHGTYLENYEELVHVLYRYNGREYYRVKDIPDNYKKVRAMLDERYADFRKMNGDEP